jgi:chromosomal replication initiator protein
VQLIWKEFLKIIKEEAGSQVVETWFKAVVLEQWNPECKTAFLQAPNQFVRNWVQEHYVSLLHTHLGRLLHTNEIKFIFTVKNESPSQQNNPSLKKIIPASLIPATENFTKNTNTQTRTALTIATQQLPYQNTNHNNRSCYKLNTRYQFDSFVVGPSNSLAHAAAYAVSQNTGKVYNPLFIYGGTGLGKTHLLHAIGNEARKKNPTSKIQYKTSDLFMHEFISSIRFEKTTQFREKYQKIDLLLLDDVQFFSNKEQTQETFFHIFNTLYAQQKQIILTSDTFPKEIGGLQNRLRSRMEWGLVVDIQTPDLETKMAILQKKANANEITLNDDVANFIASRVTSNIRALEGALVRVDAFARLTNNPITEELAKRVLLHLDVPKKKDGILLENVIKITSKHFAISINDIRSKKRTKNISIIRQIAFFLMKKHTFASLQTIGNFVGGRDHSTVIHAISKIKEILKQDTSLSRKVKAIEQEILTS